MLKKMFRLYWIFGLIVLFKVLGNESFVIWETTIISLVIFMEVLYEVLKRKVANRVVQIPRMIIHIRPRKKEKTPAINWKEEGF